MEFDHEPPSIASQLRDFYGSANAMDRRIRALSPEWYTLRSSMTDAIAYTFSLAIFMPIFAVVVYILISKRWRDSTAVIVLFFLVPECITLVMGWLFTLSRVAQVYSVLDGDMAFIRSGYDNLVESALSWNPPQLQVNDGPLGGYVMHECVATTVFTADSLMRVAVLCGFVLWSFTRDKDRKSWVATALVVVPFLATCASATMHVYSTCGPAGNTPNNLRQAWAAVSTPIRLDATTTNFTRLSTLISTVMFVQWLWQDRAAIMAQLSGDGSFQLMRYMGFTFLLPVLVNELWASVYRSYGNVNDNTALSYAFFSVTNSIIPQLTGIYPGLSVVYRRLSQSSPTPSSSDDPKTSVDLEQPSHSSGDVGASEKRPSETTSAS
ncbi:hypothetical protein C8Q70DRAFT_1048995 [Cubamyces menziesii]|uniref:Uncharacterized protein n=1 Tax=Trametes cubensis TaxID=1111947 RepID=A0AAD7U1X4_9APHY|nr:hypothetical protein C8Q70DRAFT_1048995 [Cubamyces menziesii]KAJ8496174.1 hypothetical protein ONZ51_g1289 [Trametes cubensis]